MNLTVGLDMVLCGLFGVLQGSRVMPMRQVGMMARAFAQALFVMTGGFAMMTCSVFVMLRSLPMMMRCFVRHKNSSRRAGVVAAREHYGRVMHGLGYSPENRA